MDSIKLEAYGKINLSLDIVGKRDDGYHNVQMIMQTIRLSDDVIITKNNSGKITTSSNLPYVPNNETNLSYKSARLFYDRFGITDGLHIKMHKNIPVGGGLGGGSADAAAVLQGLNQMYETHLSLGELSKMAVTLGADVPFCLRRGTYLAEGIGEELSHLPPFPETHLVLVKPPFGVSTKWVYQTLKWQEIKEHPNTLELIRALQNRDPHAFAPHMKNVLEEVVFPRYQAIQKLKRSMKAHGAYASMMSGSGATVFGLFDQKEDAVRAYDTYKKEGMEAHLTQTIEGA